MIREIKNDESHQLIDFLRKFAPQQTPFVEGNYFKHGKNIAFGFFENNNKLIGLIRYCIQQIGIEQGTPPLILKNIVQVEGKIHVFAVDKDFRNQGIGKKLQLMVIEDAKKRNCRQLASYSTFNKLENYSVKLRLGFCVQPEIQKDGTRGCYFLMKL
jgi:ribosomal protein S18 acetylase RimI-like enzyme